MIGQKILFNHILSKYNSLRQMCSLITKTDNENNDDNLDIGLEISVQKEDKFCYLDDVLDADGRQCFRLGPHGRIYICIKCQTQ